MQTRECIYFFSLSLSLVLIVGTFDTLIRFIFEDNITKKRTTFVCERKIHRHDGVTQLGIIFRVLPLRSLCAYLVEAITSIRFIDGQTHRWTNESMYNGRITSTKHRGIDRVQRNIEGMREISNENFRTRVVLKP